MACRARAGAELREKAEKRPMLAKLDFSVYYYP
jgi:hypothetical protein